MNTQTGLCINCGHPVVLRKPLDCPRHVTASAPPVNKTPRAITSSPIVTRCDESVVAPILASIGRRFAIDPGVLERNRHTNPDFKFARYFAFLVADQFDDAGYRLEEMGKKLHMNSAASQQKALYVVLQWLKCDTPRRQAALKVLADFDFEEPA